MCQDFDDPAAMTPDQRRREIAAIFARGVLRLFTRTRSISAAGECSAPQNSSESVQNDLDSSATSSPHGLAG